MVPPISVSTTFAQAAVGEHRGWEYSRSGNPTRDALETCLASLEGGRRAFAFASGLAAEDAVLRQLRPGERIVLGNDAYGGTFRLIDKVYGPVGYPWTAVDLTDPAALDRDWPPGTTLVWAETPTNPAMAIVDIAAVAELAHHHGARLVVDNTFATPYLQQPLALGADIVVHCATKYLGGHSDVVGGCVVTDDAELAERHRLRAERRRRRAVAVRLLPGAAGPQDAGRPHGPPLRQRPRRRRAAAWSIRPSSGCCGRGCRTTRAADVAKRQMRDAGRHGVVRRPGRRGRRSAAGRAAPACSRWPSRWARWSRSSSTRPA